MNHYGAGDKVICVDDTDFNEGIIHLFSETVRYGWVYVIERVRINTGECNTPSGLIATTVAVVDLRGITVDFMDNGALLGLSLGYTNWTLIKS